MAQVPVEIMTAGDLHGDSLERAITTANTLQLDFRFILVPQDELAEFKPYAYGHASADELLDRMSEIRQHNRGYHPYLIAFVDAHLDGQEFSNIFGSDRPREGLAVFTVSNVAEVIVPEAKLSAYYLYYLAKSSFSFFAPDHKNHRDTRRCVYDMKTNKHDIIQSMRARAICDECRRVLLAQPTLSASQFTALEILFAACGDLLSDDPAEGSRLDARPRVFLGSSVEGLATAQALRSLLSPDLAVDLWNEGTVFGLGDATLEALERAVLSYDFGVFVFTPDDKIHSRGELKPVARDNVLFELGLFIGKLTRKRAFVVHPSKRRIAIASDLAGITTAQYDPDQPDGMSLQPVREAIVRAVQRMLSGREDR